MQSLFTAASGLSSQQKRLETLASNIANSGTTGYKTTRTDFKDALYSVLEDPALVGAEANNLFAGSGVTLSATSINFEQGAIATTGVPLDFAIQGSGFFQAETASGETLYTRGGSFNTAVVGNDSYLVTAQGYFVLDSEGNRIKLPSGNTKVSVAEDGQIQFIAAQEDSGSAGSLPIAETTQGQKIGLIAFENPEGLSPSGESCYAQSETSGQPNQDTLSTVVQGGLESSNVDLSQELTMLIRAQRAYSLASRALTTSDDMLGLANNMR